MCVSVSVYPLLTQIDGYFSFSFPPSIWLISDMCDLLEVELKWELCGPTVSFPSRSLCRRELEARA